MIGAAAIALPRLDINGIDAILGVRRFERPTLRMCRVDTGQEACADQYGSRDSRSAEEVHFGLRFTPLSGAVLVNELDASLFDRALARGDRSLRFPLAWLDARISRIDPFRQNFLNERR
jgi:hypothetical protein